MTVHSALQKQLPRVLTLLGGLFALSVVGYVALYAIPFPLNEQYYTSSYVAMHVQDGTFTLADLSRRFLEHHLVFSHLTTALSAALFNWNVRLEAFIALGSLLVYTALCVDMLRRAGRVALLWGALPLVAVMLTLQQRTNLIWSFTAMQWQYVNFFAVLALWTLATRAVSWRAALLAGLLATCSLFSSSAGVLSWAVIVPVMWLRGYRHWGTYVLWIGALFSAVMLHQYGLESGAGGTLSTLIANLDVWQLWTFVASFWGALFVPDATTAQGVAYQLIAGAGLLALTFAALQHWRAARTLPSFWVGLVLYGAGCALLTGLSRSEVPFDGYFSRFMSMSLMFWAGVVGLLATAIPLPNTPRAARWAGGALFAAMVGAQALAGGVMWWRSAHEQPLVNGFLKYTHAPTDEKCYWALLANGDPACLLSVDDPRPGFNVVRLREIFDARLTLYAAYDGYNPAVAQLGAWYLDGEPLIIAAPHAYQHTLQATFTERGGNQAERAVPAANLVRILPHTADASPQLSASAALTLTGENPTDAETLLNAVGIAPRVWYLRGAAETDFDVTFRTVLESAYTPVKLDGGLWRTTVYQDITLYVRKPSPLFTFGDALTLHGWRLLSDVQQRACGSVTVEYLLSASAPLDINASVGVVLADAGGVGAARADGAPNGYMTSLWQPADFYRAQSTVNLPCDTPAGEYALLFTMNNPDAAAVLPITRVDGEPIGDVLYLTTIFVE